MQLTSVQDILDQAVSYLQGIWRYRWYAILFAWLIGLAGWAAVLSIPDQYRASARVFVDTESMIRPLMRGLTVQIDVSQRLRLMTRTLLSRPNLEKIARMADLDLKTDTPRQFDSLISKLSDSIRLQTARRENLYTISYENEDPETAKRVVQSTVTIFVEKALGETRKDSDAAQRFLQQQIKDYEKRLTAAEDRLTEFKRRNMNVLQGGDFFTQLKAAEQNLKQAKLKLREAELRRDELQRQLVEARESRQEAIDESHPLLETSVDDRLQSLRAQLDELLLKYTEQHPDIKELQRTVAALEEERRKELRQRVKASGDGSEASPVIQQLKAAIGEANANVAALLARVDEYQKEVDELQRLVNTRLNLETELKRLNRDYGIQKKNYDALVSRLESAKMSEQVEQTGDNVKFKVIDPPTVPHSPSYPDRTLFSGGVLFAALGLGLALAFALSQIRPVIYDRRSLDAITGLPVWASVSMVWNSRSIVRKRLDAAGIGIAGVGFVSVFAGVIWLGQHDRPDFLVSFLREFL